MAEKQQLVKYLCCYVCSETFKYPVSLCCNHSFCRACLFKFWEQAGNNNCPVCKRKSSKDHPGINYSLKELADSFAGQLKQDKTPDERKEVMCSKHTKAPTWLVRQQKKVQLNKAEYTEVLGDDLLPPVRLLKLKPTVDGQLNKKVFGSPPTNKPSNKTIMVVGATGSGKTTLINGMINYVLGVEWEDNWRYKLIDEQTNKTQANSQTSEVTAYQIYRTDGFQVPFSLTIIDTPGFGDTRGIKQDKEITEKIRQFFSVKGGIDHIDAVCFVVQSALARLTHTQTYIFDSILSIFGKDIADNITVLVTFADGQSPPVLEAIKAANIPCALSEDGSPLHFKFNNSVLFAKNTGASSDEDIFDSMFWKMGEANMKKFFTHLNWMKPKSLNLTKEVLNDRRQLEATVEGVQPLIQAGLSKLEEINKTKAALENHKTHMKANEDFDYEVDGKHQKRTYQELKIKYETALGDKMTTEKIIQQLEVEYEQVQREVVEMMETSAKSLQRLREIALHPDPLSTPDYIDILIQTEKQEAKPGYQKRMKELQEVRERAVLLKNMAEGVRLTRKEKLTYEKMNSKVKGIFNNAASWLAS